MTTLNAPFAHEVSFAVTGMTCASCVRRIEKALNKIDGIQQASVNLATEKARVVYDPEAVTFDTLRAAVEKAGYGVSGPNLEETIHTAEAPRVERDATDQLEGDRQRESHLLRDCDRHHCADPARQMDGGKGKEADRRSDQSLDGAAGEKCPGHPQRYGAVDPGGLRARWRPGPRTARRKSSGGW